VRPSAVSSAVCLLTFAASAVAVCALAACGSPSEAPRDVPPAPSGPVADTPEALAERLGPGALAGAFARLDATAYEATVVVEELDPSSIPLGQFSRDLRHTPGGPVRVLRTRASGTLADTSGIDPARLALRDPLPSVLPDTPAYLAPATRDQYAVRLGSRRGAVRTVEVAHTADTDQAVGRVRAAVDTATGDVLRVVVERASRSAIYDESTRAEVRLRAAPGGPLPSSVETVSNVSTPLSGIRTYRVTWRVGPAQTNTR